jgi:hypothetical protein
MPPDIWLHDIPSRIDATRLDRQATAIAVTEGIAEERMPLPALASSPSS